MLRILNAALFTMRTIHRCIALETAVIGTTIFLASKRSNTIVANDLGIS